MLKRLHLSVANVHSSFIIIGFQNEELSAIKQNTLKNEAHTTDIKHAFRLQNVSIFIVF